MEEVKIIKKMLAETYGKNDDGRSKFRLIWSESEDGLEKRRGTVQVYYGSIFIREESGVHELRKMNYVRDRWVLERLMYNGSGEIVADTHETYEPFYVFQDKDGEYLKPLWIVCQLLCDQWLENVEGKRTLRTEKMDRDEDKKTFAKEVLKFEEYLEGELSYTASMLANKEGVVVPVDVKSMK